MTSKEAIDFVKEYPYLIRQAMTQTKRNSLMNKNSKALDILESLSKRDTPLKIKNPYVESPTHEGDRVLKESHCKCNNGVINNDFDFCPKCGQRLDWSE